MVLFATSPFALQKLIELFPELASDIDMSYNSLKTMCMIFNPTCKHNTECHTFSEFTLKIQLCE